MLFRTRSYRYIICAALSVFFSVACEGERLPIRFYTTDDGLPLNRVNDIMADSRGFLWFSTNEGLSRFDGYQFRTFGLEDGLPSRVVTTAIEASDGRLWVGTTAGLLVIPAPANSEELRPAGRPFQIISVPGGLVTILLEDHRHRIWCGTGNGLFVLEQPRKPVKQELRSVPIRPLPEGDGELSALVEDASGGIWASFHDCLYFIQSNSVIQRYTASEGSPHNIHALMRDGRGRIWIGSWSGLHMVISPAGSRKLVTRMWRANDGLSSNIIHSFLRTRDGELWAVTEHGLTSWSERSDTPQFSSYGVQQGIPRGRLDVAVEDRRGNIWLGTESHAVICLARNGLTAWSRNDGLLSDKIRDVFVSPSKQLVVVTRIDSPDAATNRNYPGHILYTIRDGRLHPVLPVYDPKLNYAGWGERQVVLQDHLGEWWIASGRGLYRYPAVNIEKLAKVPAKRRYTVKDGLWSDDVFRIAEDKAGNIWIGTMDNGGIARWDRATGRIHRLTAADGLPGRLQRLSASAIATGESDDVWLGWWATPGVGRYRNNHLQVFDTASGFAPGWVTDIFLDHKGRLWIASTGGLSRVDHPGSNVPSVRTYDVKNGLATHAVRCIAEDAEGSIYLGTDRGLDRLDPETGSVLHYAIKDGLLSDVIWSATRDAAGVMWFGTHAGMARLQPTMVSAGSEAQVTFLLTGVRAAGKPIAFSPLGRTSQNDVVLPAGQGLLEVEYTDLAFGSAGPLRYQYKFGSDPGWSAPASTRSLTFAGLQPGSYELLVRAIDSTGTPRSAPVSLRFRALPQFWQVWWFRASILVFLGTLLWAAHRYRVGTLLEMQRLRSRIALDLHDDVGSSLTQIAIWSEIAQRENGLPPQEKELLSQIAHASRTVIENISDIVWAANPQRDSLRDLVQRTFHFANNLCTANNLILECRTPAAGLDRDLSPDTRRHLYLIAKEAVHNAVRHSGCSRIVLEFIFAPKCLRLTISDDGCGLPLENGTRGHGLASMKQRAAALHGAIEWSHFGERGTRVHLSVPMLVRPKTRTALHRILRQK